MHAGTSSVDERSCVIWGRWRKPGCMGRPQRGSSDKRQRAHERQRAQNDRSAAERVARVEREVATRRLGGSALTGLRFLGELSDELQSLHSRETEILFERDRIVADLRAVGTSWNVISLRTGLSRQALSKRPGPLR
jgi:hypothetical protein